MVEEERQDVLGEVDLFTDHHRLAALSPSADVRPHRVVEDLVGLRQKPSNIGPARAGGEKHVVYVVVDSKR